MKLKKATAVKKEALDAFIERHERFSLSDTFDGEMNYVIEDDGVIIGWFQIEFINNNDLWLKKLFIVQKEALKLPLVLRTIIKFAEKNNIVTLYVQSKQFVTDLLLSSFSFNLQEEKIEHQLSITKREKWWYYTFVH